MKKNTKKQSVKLDIPIYTLDAWEGDLQKLPPNQTFELVINYPLSTPAIYKIRTGKSGMGLVKLLKTIGKAYQKTYENAEHYGIWGHGIGNLFLEGLTVDFQAKKITLSMGS